MAELLRLFVWSEAHLIGNRAASGWLIGSGIGLGLATEKNEHLRVEGVPKRSPAPSLLTRSMGK
jgi:hypothetical protein